MARRASSSTPPAWLAIAVAVVLAFAGGGYILYHQLSDPFRTIAPLPMEAYLKNANSLRGNRYQIEAVVASQLGWSSGKGRLYSMDLAASQEVVAVLVPAQFNDINLQKGQRFLVEVEIDERGLLLARNLSKA